MRQTGTWSRWDPKYLVQRRWEEQVKRRAAALITVSHGYARHLRERDGVPADRLHTVPCWVDGERFRIDTEARLRLRRQLGIGERLALIYAGKFGGITVLFSPYDVGPYAEGAYIITVPASELEGKLTPDWSARFGGEPVLGELTP